MAHIPYTKPPATALQRVTHLKRKGLVITRPNVAARKIEHIGYERLRIYFLSRRQQNVPGKPFVPGTSYRDIIALYDADTKIRILCFKAVGQFELLFRNSISENLSQQFGSHPYDEIAIYKDAGARIDVLKILTGIYEKSKDARAKHYKETYSTPSLPPVWTMKEFMTFGVAAGLFKSLSNPLKTSIAIDFGINSVPVFESWVRCLVDLRNICAHHDRLFNRHFQKQPVRLRRLGLPGARNNTLKAQLECVDYLLSNRGMQLNVTDKINTIIMQCPQITPAEAGF